PPPRRESDGPPGCTFPLAWDPSGTPARPPTASSVDSAQWEPVSKPMDSVQWTTDKPSTPTPTAPTAHARRRACFIPLRAPRGLLVVRGLRAGFRAVPLTDGVCETPLRPDMGTLRNREPVLRAGRVLLAPGLLAFQTGPTLLDLE